MSIDLRLAAGLRLQQRMTPQLIQFMRLVALPHAELQNEVESALVEYPALEERGAETEPPEPSRSEAREDDDAEWLRYLNGGPGRDLSRLAHEREQADEEGSLPGRASTAARSLSDHLREQLYEAYDDPHALRIGEWIIASLDAAGYLDDDVDSIARRLRIEPDAVAGVLDRIQRFDPLGVAARDARETLMIQARERFPEHTNLERLIDHHLPALRAGRYATIAQALGVTVADVVEEEARLLMLDPRPARGFGDGEVLYVTPDVSVVPVGGQFVVRVNDSGLPRLRLSVSYRRILERPEAYGREDRTFARAKVAAARWFLRNLYERQRTIRRVTESIVRLQRDFFDRGPGHLRPLTLRDVAEDIRLVESTTAEEIRFAESTVSRATASKYVDTPHGIFELKHFFGGGLPTGGGGEAVAVESVKRRIQQLVTDEDSARPLSDQEIAARLTVEGIVVARRTVTKYRERLGLDASPVRRRRRRGAGSSVSRSSRPSPDLSAPVSGHPPISQFPR